MAWWRLEERGRYSNGIPVPWTAPPRRRWKGLAFLALLCIVEVGRTIACGGGGSAGGGEITLPVNPGPITGSYSVTVTATSGPMTASSTIPLSVQ